MAHSMQNNNENSENDEDDVIVEEIPVFLSNNMKDDLYVFQYPNKSHSLNFDHSTVLESKVKPDNKEVTMCFALDIESPHYDNFKGKQFAQAAEPKNTNNKTPQTFKRGIMDRQILSSVKTVEDAYKYVAGIYIDREIHLTPVSSILQLRPTFSYIDSLDKKNKDADKTGEQEDEEEEELQAVTVKFSKPGVKKTKKKQGYDAMVKANDEEPWYETFYHPRETPLAELGRQQLYCTNQDVSSVFNQECSKYLEKLMPREKTLRKIDELLPPPVISKTRLCTFPLIDQLKHILKDGKLQRFDTIVSYVQKSLHNNVTADKILRLLPQVGVLIHGNWCLQSEILYPADSFSNINGVNSEHMCRGRNYVLNRFFKGPYLNRCQVAASTGLPTQELLEILESVARLNKELKWELLLPPDNEFEQRYPEQVMRQKVTWNAQISRDLGSPKRIRKRSARESFSKSSLTAHSVISESPSTAMVTDQQ